MQPGGDQGALAVAITLAVYEIPMALVRPAGGVLADRFDRRDLLVVVHVEQGVLTAVMAWRAMVGDLVSLQVLVLIRSLLAGLGWPARSGALRRLVAEEDLLLANAFSGATWSAMCALGMALGGLVSSFGVAPALARDAGTFWSSCPSVSRRSRRAPWSTPPGSRSSRRCWRSRARHELVGGDPVVTSPAR